VRRYIEDGTLTAGHARALVATDSPQTLAEQIIKLGLNVREAEGISRRDGARDKGASAKAEKDADTIALERHLSETLGLKVNVAAKSRSGGSVTIQFKTLEQLDDICHRLTRAS
jgi:ParB family chromosome partitioning protein